VVASVVDQIAERSNKVKKAVIISGITILLGAGSLLPAADRVPAEYFYPKHILASTRPPIQCPPGYSRLFGRNPPTCYENCPPGWTVKSNVTAGAVCVRCPQGYVPAYDGGFNSHWCQRIAGERGAGGSLWGQ
jgi:hypothetical protein